MTYNIGISYGVSKNTLEFALSSRCADEEKLVITSENLKISREFDCLERAVKVIGDEYKLGVNTNTYNTGRLVYVLFKDIKNRYSLIGILRGV